MFNADDRLPMTTCSDSRGGPACSASVCIEKSLRARAVSMHTRSSLVLRSTPSHSVNTSFVGQDIERVAKHLVAPRLNN